MTLRVQRIRWLPTASVSRAAAAQVHSADTTDHSGVSDWQTPNRGGRRAGKMEVSDEVGDDSTDQELPLLLPRRDYLQPLTRTRTVEALLSTLADAHTLDARTAFRIVQCLTVLAQQPRGCDHLAAHGLLLYLCNHPLVRSSSELPPYVPFGSSTKGTLASYLSQSTSGARPAAGNMGSGGISGASAGAGSSSTSMPTTATANAGSAGAGGISAPATSSAATARERNGWNVVWCSMVSIVTQMIASLGGLDHEEEFLRSAVEFMTVAHQRILQSASVRTAEVTFGK